MDEYYGMFWALYYSNGWSGCYAWSVIDHEGMCSNPTQPYVTLDKMNSMATCWYDLSFLRWILFIWFAKILLSNFPMRKMILAFPFCFLLFFFCFVFVFFFWFEPMSYELTAHNSQKWKRVFLKCFCHKIYRVEAVGLKSSNYTWKIMIFANMWNLGQFREKLILCQ